MIVEIKEDSVKFTKAQMDPRRAGFRRDVNGSAISVAEQERIYYTPRPRFRFDWEGGLQDETTDAVSLQHQASAWRC